MTLARQVTGVVRSVGERTADVCGALLAAQLGHGAEVVTVGNKPFPETLADSLRAGIAARRPWTLCVDADVLVLPGAVAALVAEAETFDQSVAEVQPVVFDRFFGGWRPAGVHLYRTAHLPRAVQILGTMPDSIRPEAALLHQLAANGLPWHQASIEFGLHDFEQAPRDVFRKCFVHARKHADLAPALERYWRSRAQSENDFAVALEGLNAGAAHAGAIALDATAPYLAGDIALDPGPPLRGVDPVQMLEQEERALATVAQGVAPVWDWLQSSWAEETGIRRTVDGFIRRLLAAGPGPWLVDGLDSRTRVFLHAASSWGLPIDGVVDTSHSDRRYTFQSVPVLSEPAARAAGAGRIRRTLDGRFVAGTDRPVVEEQPGSAAGVSEPASCAGLVDRLRRAGVERVLVYGAGQFGRELATAASRACEVVGFVESTPAKTLPSAFVPLFDPVSALQANADVDVVIASHASAPAMVRQLLAAAAVANSRPRGIWLVDA